MNNLKNYTVPQFTDAELAEIFPEMQEIVEEKIAEYEADIKQLMQDMKFFVQRVNEIATQEKKDGFFIWFWSYAYLRYFCVPRMVQIHKHLQRLYKQRRLFTRNNNQNYTEYRWNEMKERAKNKSLYVIALPYLERVRQTGNNFSARCPFHKDKTPSFFIYQKTNTFHCYGCQTHGDVITFYMRINKIPFKDAVKELAA